MRPKMTNEDKYDAYVLSRNFNYTMIEIAKLLGVSQSTISTSIKEVEYWVTIGKLIWEIQKSKEKLVQQGFRQQLVTKIPVINPIEKIQR